MISSKKSSNQLHILIAFIVAITLSIYSGWRDVGIDRENYIVMYNGIVSNDDLTIKFWYAKDIFFLIISELASYVSDDYKIAFFVSCFFSVMLKYFSIKKLSSKHILYYFFLYSVFLSPGLEFAAIRGGIAIGFIMLAISYRDQTIKFFAFSLLAITAHLSAFLVIILLIKKVNTLLSKYKLSYIAVSLIIFIFSEILLELLPKGTESYDDFNRGTLFSLFDPAVTLLAAFLIFYKLDQVAINNSKRDIYTKILFIKQIVYGLIAIAFGFTSLLVPATTRYLEISWCLLIIVSIIMFKKSFINMMGVLLFFSLLSYMNIRRFTWLAIINPALVS